MIKKFDIEIIVTNIFDRLNKRKTIECAVSCNSMKLKKRVGKFYKIWLYNVRCWLKKCRPFSGKNKTVSTYFPRKQTNRQKKHLHINFAIPITGLKSQRTRQT